MDNVKTVLVYASIFFVVILLGFMWILRNEYNSGFREGYSENNVPQESLARAATLGRQEADNDLAGGALLHFYKTTIFLAGVSGLVIGVMVQLAWLAFAASNNKKISELDAVIAPGANYSEAYKALLSRKKMIVVHESKLSELEMKRQRKLKRIAANYEEEKQKLLAADSLDELAAVKTARILNSELDAVVAANESKVQKKATQNNGKRTHRCPSCGKKVIFRAKLSGKRASCPNSDCGKPIQLPR